jgi:hypothetical protein
MGQENSAQRAAGRLLPILSKEELTLLAGSLGLKQGASIGDISDTLAALPRYEITRVVLSLANSTIRLLQDVFDSLAMFGVSARTTGCVFVLADPIQPGRKSELEFSPQAVGSIAAWRTDRNRKPMADSLQELKSRWRQLSGPLSKILKAAVPEQEEGDINFVETAIRNRLARAEGVVPPGLVRGPDRLNRDEGAERVLRFVKSQVAEISTRLSQIPDDSLPLDVEWILRDASEFLRQARKVLPERSSPRERAQPNKIELRPYERFLRDFDRLREDLFLLADLTEGDRLFDLLRLDVWSSRPQLYEVWVLLTILRWLAGRGYDVELLKIRQSAGIPKWELVYSKDDESCAKIQGASGTPAAYLFYQLYRPSGDMPDLALLKGRDGESIRVWSVDPKHSEREGYSIKDYRFTAERYRDSFGAPLSIIAEYFERADCGSNPVDFGNGACLVHNCRPGAAGLNLLLQQLSRCHPLLSTTLVCIDVSKSFWDHLPSVLAQVRQMVDDPEERCLEEFICFGGSARKLQGLRSFLEFFPKQDVASLGVEDGTRADPLVDAVSESVRHSTIRRVLLVTDGSFDKPIDAVVQHLRSEMRLEVALLPQRQ